MEIVVDTSAIIAVIVGEPQRQTLIELTAGADLIAPPSVHWEIGNALSAMLRRGRVSLGSAAGLGRDVFACSLMFSELLEAALHLLVLGYV